MTSEFILHKMKRCVSIVSIHINFCQNRFINEWATKNIAKILEGRTDFL